MHENVLINRKITSKSIAIAINFVEYEMNGSDGSIQNSLFSFCSKRKLKFYLLPANRIQSLRKPLPVTRFSGMRQRDGIVSCAQAYP